MTQHSTTRPKFYTTIKGRRYFLAAQDVLSAMEQASQTWVTYRDAIDDNGCSKIGNGCRVYSTDVTGPPCYVGAVSYNGRIWTPEQTPFAAAAVLS